MRGRRCLSRAFRVGIGGGLARQYKNPALLRKERKTLVDFIVSISKIKRIIG